MDTKVLAKNLVLPEGPRWHEGRLWFSDAYAGKVNTIDLAGNIETIIEVPQFPSGLGWLPDGRLLIVSIKDRRLLRLDSGELTEVADLRNLAGFYCNDMVVDTLGRAYIGHYGFDFQASPFQPKTAEIMLVFPNGDARIVADDLAFPNGTVITPDGRVLIVAESGAAMLTAFDIADDGSLSNRRVWARFDDLERWNLQEGRVVPDGICLDAAGGIWVASPWNSELLRVEEGGEVTHRYTFEVPPYACMLGGEDRRTLFILGCTKHANPDQALAQVGGQIEIMHVDVPGAGLP
jgi:sugar lactone lactonase YvrE